jgi:hypothetical protein
MKAGSVDVDAESLVEVCRFKEYRTIFGLTVRGRRNGYSTRNGVAGSPGVEAAGSVVSRIAMNHR